MRGKNIMTKNIKLYSWYRIFSYDIFFFNVISFFYFTTVKNLTVTQILFLEALYPIYQIVLQIPSNTIAQRIGAKKSIIIGNLCWVIGFATYILAPSIAYIIVGDILFALGNVLKQITEPALLIHALKEEKKEEDFNKIEGAGVGKYYYIETITSILAGFFFAINPYLPFILGTIMSLISLFISFFFENVNATLERDYNSIKEYLVDLKHSITNIITKERLKALILYSAIFSGIIAISTCYYKNMLSNLGMDTGNFGIVFALLTIIQGIACQRQYAVERKTKNKTLTWTGLSFTAIFIVIGILGISGVESTLLISLIVLLLVIQKIIEGTYQISIKKYMVNFTTPSTITSVLTSNTLFNNIGTSLVVLFGAFVLDNLDMNYGYIFVGCVGFVIMLLIVAFMKTRVGLRPEEYKEYTAQETENPV